MPVRLCSHQAAPDFHVRMPPRDRGASCIASPAAVAPPHSLADGFGAMLGVLTDLAALPSCCTHVYIFETAGHQLGTAFPILTAHPPRHVDALDRTVEWEPFPEQVSLGICAASAGLCWGELRGDGRHAASNTEPASDKLRHRRSILAVPSHCHTVCCGCRVRVFLASGSGRHKAAGP